MLKMDRVKNFSKVGDSAPIPILTELQTRSYERFLQKSTEPTHRKSEGLEGLLREVFPIISYDESMKLEYLYYELSEARYKPQECRDLRLTYGLPLRIRCRFSRKDIKDVLEESIYVGEIPIMIGGGEFIINGAERVIVSQLHRSPGVDFTVEMQESDRPLHGARIIPERGSWIELTVTKKDSILMRIDQSSKIPATMFLRSMDEKYGSTASILREFYDTEKVSSDKLRPQMYLVEAFIDPDSGEELVPSGGQIGDALNMIITAPSGVPGEIREKFEVILDKVRKSGDWKSGEEARKGIPSKPGIYVFRYKKNKKVAYVGITASKLRDRLGMHWRGDSFGSELCWHVWLEKVASSSELKENRDKKEVGNDPKARGRISKWLEENLECIFEPFDFDERIWKRFSGKLQSLLSAND